jgi:hypothetical protein
MSECSFKPTVGSKSSAIALATNLSQNATSPPRYMSPKKDYSYMQKHKEQEELK